MGTEGLKGALLSTLLLALLMSLLLISAEAALGQDIEWIRQFGTSSDDYAEDVAVDTSGDIYAIGYTGGTLLGQTSSGGYDAFVRKYDGSGSELWTRQFGSPYHDSACGVTTDPSSNVYIVGWTRGTLPGQISSGGPDAFVRKYDGSGSELWTRQFGSPAWDYAEGVAVDTFDNVYVAGYTQGALPGQTSAGGLDAFLVKFAQIVRGVEVSINPNTLNLKSRGRWITCFIELPEGYDVADIDIGSIRLNGVVPAEEWPTGIGGRKLMVKFSRPAVQAIVSIGEVELTVTGLVNGVPFEGNDTIRVIKPGKADLELRLTDIPMEWSLAPPGERTELEIELSEIPLQWALAPS